MDEKKKRNIKEVVKNLLPILIFVILAVIITLIFLPEIKKLATDEGREAFKSFVDSFGIFGWLIGLGISLLQIFVAFIPGEPVEIVMGFVFGPVWGTVICLLANLIASLGIFFFVKRFGLRFIKRAVGDKELTKFKFLSNEKRLELAVLLLFLIPGTPKDVLLYIVPLSKIRFIRYIFITTIARIPSVVTSTVLGDSIAEGNYITAVIVFIITALVAFLGIIFANRYIDRKKKNSTDSEFSDGEA